MAATQTMQTEKFATSTVISENKTTVPVVTHVITDEDIGALQVWNKRVFSHCFWFVYWQMLLPHRVV